MAATQSQPAPKNHRGRAVTVFSVDPADLVLVKDRNHPLYDERVHKPLDEDMIASIMLSGVHETLLVRKNGPYFEVINGRQRTKNAVEANKRLRAEGRPSFRVMVRPITAQDRDYLAIGVTTNEVRSPDEVLIKAAKAQRLLHHLGHTLREVAVYFKVSQETVENWLKLNDLHRDVRALVARGKIKYTVAMRLASLPREKQLAKLREIVSARASNANAVRAVRGGKLEKVRPPSRQQLRRLADFFLAQEGFLNGERSSDVYTVVSWVLGRISPEEVLACLSSPEAGIIGAGIKAVSGLK